MPQTSVSADPVTGLAGELAYNSPLNFVQTKFCRMTGGIPFGVFVSRQANGKVKLPAASGDVTATGIGIALRDQTKEPGVTNGYDDLEIIPVLRRGYIQVSVEAAVTEEGAVYARITANGGNTQLGALRGDTDSGNAAAVPNARFVTSTSGAGIAIVEIR